MALLLLRDQTLFFGLESSRCDNLTLVTWHDQVWPPHRLDLSFSSFSSPYPIHPIYISMRTDRNPTRNFVLHEFLPAVVEIERWKASLKYPGLFREKFVVNCCQSVDGRELLTLKSLKKSFNVSIFSILWMSSSYWNASTSIVLVLGQTLYYFLPGSGDWRRLALMRTALLNS